MNTTQLLVIGKKFEGKKLIDVIEFNGVWGMVFEDMRGFKYYPKTKSLEICKFKVRA